VFYVALKSLLHERGKLVAALTGVAFAATLVIVQLGLYVGFLDSASSLITHAGGDLWVMAKGTEVFDTGERMAAGSRDVAAAHPCVRRVRGLVYGWAIVRRSNGSQQSVQIVGMEQGPAFPWTLARGLPADLHAHDRVAVDRADLEKLLLPADALNATLDIGDRTTTVAAVSRGIRSFTLQPFVFAEAPLARRLLSMDDDEATFWVLNVDPPSCVPAVEAALSARADLQALTTGELRARTEEYWVTGSGAGAALAFSAALGLIVGIVIVGQTLYTLTKERERELVTFKAMGASSGELVGFVIWQATALALVGGALGLALAYGVRELVAAVGLTIVLSPGVVAAGCASVLAMCALSSVGSLHRVLRLDPAEVFQ
jgi:putative ABC transport system permease protein